MDTQLIVEKKIVVFVSQPDYEPAQQLIALLKSTAGMFQVIQTSELNTINFADNFTIVVFITPADFPKAMYLSGAISKIAQESQAKKISLDCS